MQLTPEMISELENLYDLLLEGDTGELDTHEIGHSNMRLATMGVTEEMLNDYFLVLDTRQGGAA